MLEFLEEVLLDGLLDTLKLLPFLFLTYLFMEFLEHKASDKTRAFLERSGNFGPLVGGLVGALPQCGFSSASASLYTGRVITAGTLIAVFLSTSDEMLPILISGAVPIKTILLILAYKAVGGILAGFAVDLILRLFRKPREEIDIDELCERDGCHCERGILLSALHHTLSISLFILIITCAVNALVFFVGDEALSGVFSGLPVVSHAVAALIGLIPNCAASVALTRFYMEGILSLGAMLSGLFSGAGVGLLILFRQNRHLKENLLITLTLVLVGIAFGLLADLPALSALFG